MNPTCFLLDSVSKAKSRLNGLKFDEAFLTQFASAMIQNKNNKCCWFTLDKNIIGCDIWWVVFFRIWLWFGGKCREDLKPKYFIALKIVFTSLNGQDVLRKNRSTSNQHHFIFALNFMKEYVMTQMLKICQFEF